MQPLSGAGRRRFLEEVNDAYAAVRADEAAWAIVEDERTVWDTTLADGLPKSRRVSCRS